LHCFTERRKELFRNQKSLMTRKVMVVAIQTLMRKFRLMMMLQQATYQQSLEWRITITKMMIYRG